MLRLSLQFRMIFKVNFKNNRFTYCRAREIKNNLFLALNFKNHHFCRFRNRILYEGLKKQDVLDQTNFMLEEKHEKIRLARECKK